MTLGNTGSPLLLSPLGAYGWGMSPGPFPNSSMKGTGKQMIARTLSPPPPHSRLEGEASGSLAFQKCSETFSAINGLRGGHLCPPLPQLLLAHAASQFVKGRLVPLVEVH